MDVGAACARSTRNAGHDTGPADLEAALSEVASLLALGLRRALARRAGHFLPTVPHDPPFPSRPDPPPAPKADVP